MGYSLLENLDDTKEKYIHSKKGKIDLNENIENTDTSKSLEEIIHKMLLQNEMSLDAIYMALGDKCSIEDLSVSLVELEMDGRIVKTGSRYFAIS